MNTRTMPRMRQRCDAHDPRNPAIYRGLAGELLRRAEDETASFQSCTASARALPWWRFRLRRRWLALAEEHRQRALVLVAESEAADA
jgi:hypothetical protein